eukprot:CAMPEP_0171023174 /NCGR_PEP_ID=MMETSP0736-20130129/32027_1 /TAXON_ID=186038 /ORGANISM="Fragilariopsis kerguelensis, Strain L26-C5" /LENGTH=73 /DNA_ID=CAMNT_0011462463 /DNA_START=39 /DNA_END=257 /DNA_ORIENTATION=+
MNNWIHKVMVDPLQDPMDDGYRIASRTILPLPTTQPQQPALREMVLALTNRVQQLEEEVGTLKKELHEQRTQN